MNNVDFTYSEFLKTILYSGNSKSDRTGTGTISYFGPQMRFNLEKGFPLLTIKRIHIKSVIYELLWIINGDTNVKYLQDNGVKIWDAWSLPNGNLGKIYGSQMRNFAGNDQLLKTVQGLKDAPDSRRHVITLWNPDDLDKQQLACCHGTVIQFYVNGNKLSCHMYQRSADALLGVPFNIASYALFTHMIAQVTGLGVGELIMSFGDAHIYNNHLEQVEIQLSRDSMGPSPTLKLNPEIKDITMFKYEDIEIIGYNSHLGIKAPIAV